jgi:membrane-bound lytic murein transglycosylase C
MKLLLLAIATLTTIFLLSSQGTYAQDPFDELEKEAPTKTSETRGKSSKQRYEEYKRQQVASYEAYKKKLLENWKKYKAINDEEQERFEATAGEHWEEPVTSTDKEWVEYSSDLTKRSRVDFEQETIRIETDVDALGKAGDAEIRAALKELVTTNRKQAFENDRVASAVEARSKQEVELLETAPIKAEPLLTAYLTGKAVTSDAEVDAIVDHMMEDRSESVTKDAEGRTIQTVVVPLSAPAAVVRAAAAPTTDGGAASPGRLPTRARNVWPHVVKHSREAMVMQALVLAVIETESAFNPQAKSGIPAYGLMQIVPNSAGLDATEQIFGKGRILSASYLYDSSNNIQIGSTYLHILLYRYLKGIEDPLSRLYCAVAAYNTGAGNVSRAFIGSTRISKAFPKINSMTPQEVYEHLIENLPYEETQKYLERVSKRINKYESLGA